MPPLSRGTSLLSGGNLQIHRTHIREPTGTCAHNNTQDNRHTPTHTCTCELMQTHTNIRNTTTLAQTHGHTCTFRKRDARGRDVPNLEEAHHFDSSRRHLTEQFKPPLKGTSLLQGDTPCIGVICLKYSSSQPRPSESTSQHLDNVVQSDTLRPRKY
jgi:hypothetical protein